MQKNATIAEFPDIPAIAVATKKTQHVSDVKNKIVLKFDKTYDCYDAYQNGRPLLCYTSRSHSTICLVPDNLSKAFWTHDSGQIRFEFEEDASIAQITDLVLNSSQEAGALLERLNASAKFEIVLKDG